MSYVDRARSTAVAFSLSAGVAIVAVAASLVVLAAAGYDAAVAAQALLEGALGGWTAIAATVETSVPLVLVGLAWIIAFRANRINIGLPGQILVGGVLASVIAVHVQGLPHLLHLPLAILVAVIGGALYAGIAAFLWAKRGVNEIISTFMLNSIAILLVSYLVRGPLQESAGGLAQSDPVLGSARWPTMFERTTLTWDIVLIPILVVVVIFVLARTPVGFRLRFTGANEVAAREAGIRTVAVGAGAITVSGAAAGLVGSSLVLASPDGTLRENVDAGYGFDGIVVALLARNNPVGCVPAALLFAGLRQGGGLMEARVGVSAALVQVTVGLVIVLLAGAAFLTERGWGRAGRLRRPGVVTGVNEGARP